MRESLSTTELVNLVRRVFRIRESDRNMAVMIDLPDKHVPDNPAWRARREMAEGWVERLRDGIPDLGLEQVNMVTYPNARRNNADLPEVAFIGGEEATMEAVLAGHQVIMAPTEMSATAPLKILAKKHLFRAATMPGFSEAMIPALRLDWVEIDRRCRELKELVDKAEEASIRMSAAGEGYSLLLDLRHRTGTASGGMLVEEGKAGNLPSGETFIVPYEGEIRGDPSRTAGILPLEIEGELLFYRIDENRIIEVMGDGPAAESERKETESEPAYCNVAELGLGLLKEYGMKPAGSILMDEKLGLHIAFGRSDHFGGQVGAADFSSPDRVVHIDRVYIPEVQPQVTVSAVDLKMPSGESRPLMREGGYL